jgi:hypothetical protein
VDGVMYTTMAAVAWGVSVMIVLPRRPMARVQARCHKYIWEIAGSQSAAESVYLLFGIMGIVVSALVLAPSLTTPLGHHRTTASTCLVHSTGARSSPAP